MSRQKKTLNLFMPCKKVLIDDTWDILEKVGLKDKSRYISATLSHGDQKILEMAIALGNDPSLLILDEPTAGMSPEETEATMHLIQRLCQELQLTILLCEHDMNLVFSLTHRIMVMHQGEAIMQASPEEVRKNSEVQEAYLGDSLQ